LDIGPYLASANKNPIPCNYRLYGILIHDGNAMDSGHYYAIVKAANNMWYIMNDESVTQCNIHAVLQQEAYLLFYIRESELPVPPETEQQSLPKIGRSATTSIRSVHLPTVNSTVDTITTNGKATKEQSVKNENQNSTEQTPTNGQAEKKRKIENGLAKEPPTKKN